MRAVALHPRAAVIVPDNDDLDPTIPAQRRLLFLRGLNVGFEEGLAVGMAIRRPTLWERFCAVNWGLIVGGGLSAAVMLILIVDGVRTVVAAFLK